MKSYVARPSDIEHGWYVIDATDQVLGRLASQVAMRLRGKHKPTFTPFMDTGDFIIIVNAEKIRVTGNKLADKMYYRHTGYIGGIKSQSLQKIMSGPYPERALEHAVKGMMPRGPLGRQMLRKLKIYRGAEHPHSAQQPQTLTLNG